MRRLLILLLFCLVLAGGAAVTWQAMGQAKLVEEDLTLARALLTRASGFESGKLKDRLDLINQAEAHTLAAQQRLRGWPLRLLGVLPLAGRDVRVASAVSTSATGTVRATRKVVTALQPLQTKPPTQASIKRASDALLGLHRTLEQDLERVRAARPLITAATRDRYLEAAGSASTTAERAGQGLELAAGLYGPPGTARWFLAFQNPAELLGRLGGRRCGQPEGPQQGRGGKDDPHEPAHLVTSRVGSSSWWCRQERAIGQEAASRKPAKRPTLHLWASVTGSGGDAVATLGGAGRGSGCGGPQGSETAGCC